jgi:hypothetical protein
MFANARANVVVANPDQSNGIARIIGQTVPVNLFWQLVQTNELEGYGKVFCNELVHPSLYLLFFLSGRLMAYMEAHFAFLPLHMCVETAFASKKANHGLVQQMLSRMCRRECHVSFLNCFHLFVPFLIIGYKGTKKRITTCKDFPKTVVSYQLFS